MSKCITTLEIKFGHELLTVFSDASDLVRAVRYAVRNKWGMMSED
jgi:hypothetical protein